MLTEDSKAVSQILEENILLKNELAFLKEQLEWFKRQLFGKRSEKNVDPTNGEQLLFAGFAQSPNAPEQKVAVPAHERVKRKRNSNGQDKISLPEDVLVERTFVDVPESEKVDPSTGEALAKIGEDITRRLAFQPGSYFVKEIVRPKYASKGNDGIVCAPLPESLLDRCQADESLLADIAVKKFADHLPLYRQSEMLAREGIGISRQTLSQWMLRCGLALKPIYVEMTSQILQSGNVFIDESPVDMLDPGKGKAHQAYMWVIVGGKTRDPGYRVYNFRTDRCHSNAIEIIKDYSGVLHSDKYGAYEALANKKRFTWCPCWAHIRRKFFEAESGDPSFRRWVLRKIKYLFMLERIAWARSEDERLRIRQKKEIPIIDELISKVKDRLVNGKILPKSKLKEALGYFYGLIPYLKNYTQHPWARIDNNVAERAVRPLAIGRKNWLFVGNEDGGEAAAVLLSLIQSCRALGVNPRVYLEDIMRRLMSHPANKLYELLPDRWAKARAVVRQNC